MPGPPLETRTVATFLVQEIQGIEVFHEVPDCPLSLEARQLFMAACPVVVAFGPEKSEETDVAAEPEPSLTLGGLSLWQAGPDHKRSFILRGEDSEEWWADEHGNNYSVLTTKGNNFSNPGIMEHPVSVTGLVAYGLLESQVVGRMLAASSVMVARGISTERVLGLAEPQALPWPNFDDDSKLSSVEMLDVQTYKDRIVDGHWQELPDYERTEARRQELAGKFGDMTFFVLLRAMDSPYRLADILDDQSRANQVLNHVNQCYLDLDEVERPFGLYRQGEVARYIVEFLAPRAGVNIARLHDDLAHGYVNDLNFTALGGIVDLDSVHGESLGLGDDPATERDLAKDVRNAMFSMVAACESQMITGEQDLGDARVAGLKFLYSYFDETVSRRGDSMETIVHLGRIINSIGAMEHTDSGEPLFKVTAFLARVAYVDRFFTKRYPEEFSASVKELSAIISDIATDEKHLQGVYDVLSRRRAKYINMMTEEHVSDLTQPGFDLINSFIADMAHDKYKSPAHKAMITDITNQLFDRSFLGSERINDALPKYLTDIPDPHVRSMAVQRHLGMMIGEIRFEHAETVLRDYMPEFEVKLRELSELDLSGAVKINGSYEALAVLDSKELMMITSDVPIKDAALLLHRNSKNSDVRALPEPQGAEYRLNFPLNGEILQLISNSIFDSHVNNGPQDRSITVRFAVDKMDYLLVVGRNAAGELTYTMYG